MAASTATITYTSKTPISGGLLATGTIALAAGDYVASGMPLTFDVQGSIAAMYVSGIAGYTYVYDRTHNTLRIFQVPASAALGSAAPQAEVSGTFAAGITGDTIRFLAIFKLF